MANQACLDLSVKILKVFAYFMTFVIVLGGGVVSKGCVLFMTSQLRRDRKLQYCNKELVCKSNIYISLMIKNVSKHFFVVVFLKLQL